MRNLKFLICVFISLKAVCWAKNKPHIVIIIADDLGWNDVGFHGSNQIPTPNVDALAYNGVILNRFYSLPQCSPSRAALLTGQYPIRYGFQGLPLLWGEDRYLPFQMPTLGKKLKELGYDTHLIGKWHLGQSYRNATPVAHGFDNFFGYWNGYMGYFNHEFSGGGMAGLDMHHNDDPVWTTRGQYATDLITEKSEEVIRNHNESKPLLLIVSHLAVHTGKDGFDLEVKDVAENNKKFGYIQDERRRMYAGMTDELDKSVGETIKALLKKGILENTIVVFFSDNGAPTFGSHLLDNTGSNWPLRGQKFTVFDGGVRTVAMVYSEQLRNKGSINDELIHLVDLMPTLYYAAGGDVASLGKIDGVNQWLTITRSEKSQRSEILINIDEIRNMSALISDGGRYKLINGSKVFSEIDGGFFGECGRDDLNLKYNTDEILRSPVNIALKGKLTREKILSVREQMDLKNCRKSNVDYDPCRYNSFCLFDLFEDPCETTNIADKFPAVTERLKGELEKYWPEVKAQRKIFIDPKSNPIYYNNSWHTWLEDTRCHLEDFRTMWLH